MALKEQKTFALANLGCKVNQYDGQVMRERLAALGWREVPFRERADLYVVNTCTVTARADDKCRKQVRRAIRRNSEARVIVTGCGAECGAETFAAIEGVSAVFTRDQMVHVAAYLENDLIPRPGDAFAQGISGFAGHTRAFLKIQDGCDANCAYCIVPKVRGPMRSRPLNEVRSEAERLVAVGHIEIVLTGIHVGRYGADLGAAVCLVDAARAVLETPGVERMRVSSIEAVELTDALLDLAASDGRFCPHFHLPLQSGDDALLAAMRRRYTVAEFLGRVGRIRKRLDRPSITTDVMVGFPGETDAQFENTLAVCREAGFSRMHIFPFSPRPGTAAAEMPDPVPQHRVRQREQRLQALARELALAYKQTFVGQEIYPLVEHRRSSASGLLTGWSAQYLRTDFAGSDELMGRIMSVRVKSVTPERIRGQVSRGKEQGIDAAQAIGR